MRYFKVVVIATFRPKQSNIILWIIMFFTEISDIKVVWNKVITLILLHLPPSIVKIRAI